MISQTKRRRRVEEGDTARKVFADAEIQLIRKAELASLLRVDKWTLDNWRKAGRLPEPLVLTPQLVAWRRADILRWLEDRKANPARTRAPNARQHRRGGR